MDNLKNIANDFNRLVGDLVEFSGDRLEEMSEKDHARFDEICGGLDAVQTRLDDFALSHKGGET